MNKEERKEIVKAFALAGLPLVLSPIGTALLTLANECFNSSAKIRQDEWMKTLAKRIDEQNESFAEKIKNAQNFASLFANAQNGALTDIESDKVGLYANAFINAIKNEKMEDTKKHIFLNMLREFTVLHIRILDSLKRFEDEKINGRTFSAVDNKPSFFDNVLPDIKNDVFFRPIIKNFYDNELVYADRSLDLNIGLDEITPTRLTPLGQEFLSFISEQDKAND